MTERIGIENIALHPASPRLTLSVGEGQSVAILGPANSGKSQFLRVLLGEERPAAGSFAIKGDVAVARSGGLSRRMRLQNVVQGLPGTPGLKVTDALVHLRLAEVVNEPVSHLVDAQVAAAELLEVLVSGKSILLADGQIDRLDPLALAGFRQCLALVLGSGTTFLCTTQRTDVAAMFDSMVVLKASHVRFAGTSSDLLRQGALHRVEVRTSNKPGALALVQPFSISIEERPEGYVFTADEGQAMAAKLLVEGYGDVKMVVVRPPTLEEAVLRVLN